MNLFFPHTQYQIKISLFYECHNLYHKGFEITFLERGFSAASNVVIDIPPFIDPIRHSSAHYFGSRVSGILGAHGGTLRVISGILYIPGLLTPQNRF